MCPYMSDLLLKKAVIPAAGKGTRLHPLTLSTPKEMLPVKGRPMIYYALREAVGAGVEEICVVVNRYKEALCRYLEGAWREDLKGEACLIVLEQPEPKGSGDALWRAREFVGQDPFAWMMPDFIFWGPPPLEQMLKVFCREGATTVGLLLVPPGRQRLYGNVGLVQGEKETEGVLLVKGLSGKAPGTLPPLRTPTFKAIGRWILRPSIFPLLLENRDEEEWDDTPALQALCAKERVLGVVLKGEGFDVGNLAGYRAASGAKP